MYKQIKEYIAHYVCGPTIYQVPHLGNYRTYVFADLHAKLYRIPLFIGLTDISDKIQNLITVNYTAYVSIRQQFLKDLQTLKVKDYRLLPVTHNINGIVQLIKNLDQRGYVERSMQQVRLKVDSKLHYALWKNNRKINWCTEYGCGQPGWHVECVANVERIFKQLGTGPIIHSGGIDLKNTHHKYENFIFEVLNYRVDWIHTQHVCVNNLKMSKSKNNVLSLQTIPHLLNRFFYLSIDFNRRLDSSERTIIQKKVQYETLLKYILTKLYIHKWIPEIIKLDYSVEQLLLSGTVIRQILQNIKSNELSQLNKLYTLNKLYRVIPPRFFKINKTLKVYIEDYEVNKHNKNWTQCDTIRTKLYKQFNVLYTNGLVIYRGLTNPYKR